MGKPHPMALRERVVAFVEDGHSNREASRHFRVSPRFVNDLMILHRETGSPAAKQQGRPCGSGKLADAHERVRRRIAQNGDLTLDELRIELAARGVSAHRSSLGRLLHRLGLSQKKSLAASEQHRLDIAEARHLWIHRRMSFFCKHAHRLVFIDETSTNTKLTKRTGWSPCGERYHTDAPMNAEIFATYVETQLASTRAPRDIVILKRVAKNAPRFSFFGLTANPSLCSRPSC